MFKKRLLFLICLLAILNLQAGTYSGGSGTADSPYQIANLNDLKTLSETSEDWGKYFKQTSDIDASETISWNIGDHDNDPQTPDSAMGFSPIGLDGTASFNGSYDGDGFKISNLYINRPRSCSVALFGDAKQANLKNLAVDNIDYKGFVCLGGLAARIIKGTVTNCSASGKVSGICQIGGLIGIVGDSTTVITKSSSSCKVLGGAYLGGLIGDTYQGKIEECYSSGDVSALYNPNLIDSFSGKNFGKDLRNYDLAVGGLIGSINHCKINKSYATGNVSGVYNSIGGLVGYCNALDDSTDGYNEGSIIRNSYATGEVTGENYIGGLVGKFNAGKIEKSYARGLVTGNENLGGLVGTYSGYNCYFNDCYWDKEASNQSSSAGSDDSYGKTTAEMKSILTYENWDFPEIWHLDMIDEANNGYPSLAFQGLTHNVPEITPVPELIRYAGNQAYSDKVMNLTLVLAENTDIVDITGNYSCNNFVDTNPLEGSIHFTRVEDYQDAKGDTSYCMYSASLDLEIKYHYFGLMKIQVTDNLGRISIFEFDLNWFKVDNILAETDFEDGYSGWDGINSEDSDWKYGTSEELSSEGFSFGNESHFLGINSNGSEGDEGANGSIFSKKIEKVYPHEGEFLDYYLSFDYYYRSPESNPSTLKVFYKDFGIDDQWHFLKELTPTATWTEEVIPMPGLVYFNEDNEIQFYFLYDDNKTSAFGAGIDNFKFGYNSYYETLPLSLEGTEVEVGAGDDNDMHLTLTVLSDNDVKIDATYTIGEVTKDLEFTFEGSRSNYSKMTLSKKQSQEKRYDTQVFKATIPEQEIGTTGTIDFKITNCYGDTSNNFSRPFSFVEYRGVWLSVDPDQDYVTGGQLSFDGTLPIEIAVDFETHPDSSWRFNAVKTATNCDLEMIWKIVEFDEVPTDNQIGTLTGTIISEYDPDVYCGYFSDEFEDETSVSGHFALFLKVPEGTNNYQGLLDNTDGSHSWIKCEGAALDWTNLSGFNFGDWYLRARGHYNLGQEEELLPGRAELYQNYPNPFNPATTIKFYNNMSGRVKLTVYNVKGELVAKLIDNRMKAGYQTVKFDGASLNSGVYYYRLEVPTRTITNKMVLIK